MPSSEFLTLILLLCMCMVGFQVERGNYSRHGGDVKSVNRVERGDGCFEKQIYSLCREFSCWSIFLEEQSDRWIILG